MWGLSTEHRQGFFSTFSPLSTVLHPCFDMPSAQHCGAFIQSHVVHIASNPLLMFQAVNGKWRVPEKTLQLSALAGGWIGGTIAIQKFHHKNKKQAFLMPYYAASGVNIAGLWILLAGNTKYACPLCDGQTVQIKWKPSAIRQVF